MKLWEKRRPRAVEFIDGPRPTFFPSYSEPGLFSGIMWRMALKQLAPGAYMLPLGFVNAFFLEGRDGLVLIDTGIPGSAEKILAAVRELGRQPADIRHILLTHVHADHTGSL